MLKAINKRIRNKKGFTLVELIVVLAVLGIIAAIAVPRFTGVQEDAKIKADYATAAAIVKAARLQHTVDGVALTDNQGDNYDAVIDNDYFESGIKPQSNTNSDFKLIYDSTNDVYKIEWTDSDSESHTYTEGDNF